MPCHESKHGRFYVTKRCRAFAVYPPILMSRFHLLQTYVRDIYPFRRSVSPQLNLVHMLPEKGQELIQKQVRTISKKTTEKRPSYGQRVHRLLLCSSSRCFPVNWRKSAGSSSSFPSLNTCRPSTSSPTSPCCRRTSSACRPSRGPPLTLSSRCSTSHKVKTKKKNVTRT